MPQPGAHGAGGWQEHGGLAHPTARPFILDLEGKRRHATLEDLNNLQKLNHMASSVHIAGGPIVEPVDVPVPHRHLHMTYSALKYSDKPIVGNVTARERAEDTVEMLKLVFGEEFATNNTLHHLADQQQLAAGLGPDHAGRAQGLRGKQPGRHVLAVSRWRRRAHPRATSGPWRW